jgi:hypothetical protein
MAGLVPAIHVFTLHVIPAGRPDDEMMASR